MKSLYVKFVVITIGIMIFSGIIAFLLSNTYYQHKLKPYNDQKNTDIALSIATYINEHPDLNLEEYLDNLASTGYQFYLVERSGDGLFFGAPFRDKSLSNSTVDSVLNGNTFHGIAHFPQETFVTGFFANELRNTIGVPLTYKGDTYALFLRPDIKLLFNEMHLLFGWLLALTIILSIVLVIFSTKYLVKPISQLTSATKSLAEGDFYVELDNTRRDELGELSNSFLTMARKLEQTDEIRKEFVSNISHDIQSPLSNIKGYTNLLANESINSEERKQYITIINDEAKRLSSLTKQLLLLASLDKNEDILKKESFNLGEQLITLIKNYQWIISEKGLMIEYSVPDVIINADRSLLNNAWDNLLTNAIKYNKPSGSIEIMLEEKEKSICLTIKDTGIGISQTDQQRIFDRFYRVDTARSRSIEGTGLGLSIVNSIVKLHSGKVRIFSKLNEGSIVMVEIPKS